MHTVSGETALLQALQRRLSRSRGSLWYDRDNGTNICEFVNRAASAFEIESAIEDECSKDERVESVSASVSSVSSTEIEAKVSIQSSSGPFSFTLAISSVSVDVIHSSIGDL